MKGKGKGFHSMFFLKRWLQKRRIEIAKIERYELQKMIFPYPFFITPAIHSGHHFLSCHAVGPKLLAEADFRFVFLAIFEIANKTDGDYL